MNVQSFLAECIDYIGLGFHPDTDFADYVDIRNGEALYTPELAEKNNAIMSEAMDYCDENGLDIYEMALNLL